MLKIPWLKVPIEIYSPQDMLPVFCHIFQVFIRERLNKKSETDTSPC